MTIKVDTGVPIPGWGGNRTEYPFDTMHPGDSFFVACENGDREAKRLLAYQAGAGWCKRNRPDWKVATRKMDGGFRLWVVEKS